MVNLKSVILIHLGPIYNCLVSQKTHFLVWLWPSKKINVFLYYFILCQSCSLHMNASSNIYY